MDSCQNFPHQVFCSQLKITIFFFVEQCKMTNLSGRTILPVLVWVSGYLSCASVGKTEYGKREDKIFMLLPGSQYLDMLCCCCTVHTVHQFQWEDKVHNTDSKYYRARNKRACIDREQNSIFQSGEAQLGKFVFHRIIYSAGATGHHVTRFKFLFSATVSKTGGLSCS